MNELPLEKNLLAIDIASRTEAIDVTRSFIVDAPAGSGKTTLLVERFLALLCTAEKSPEEILAITFTKKAQEEMRSRIMHALTLAKNNVAPPEINLQRSFELAQRVLSISKDKNWHLEESPQRLHILTIDAFCRKIVSRMPLLTGFGNEPEIIDEISKNLCYKKAVAELMENLESEDDQLCTEALKTLLLHLDNNFEHIETLLINLLACRDHWLPYIVPARQNIAELSGAAILRQQLEKNLNNIVEDAIKTCNKNIPSATILNEIISLTHFAAANLNRKEELKIFEHTPSDLKKQLIFWRFTAEIFLTKQFHWRKKVDKQCGFPAEKQYTARKKQMESLIESLLSAEKFRLSLKNISLSPPNKFNDEQWQILAALFRILPLLVAHLKIIFQQKEAVDFSEIALRAINALGSNESPTDLALNLDYQLKHILIDEFQDTSITQYTLLKQLTSNWQEDDGKTIFLVGDPLQSIYRFRDANVSLFLHAKERGVGNIKLQPLELKINFRTCPSLLDWLNKTFVKILPSTADINTGQVQFKPSATTKTKQILNLNNKDNKPVNFYPLVNSTAQDEANVVIDIIKKIHEANTKDKVAILVKARRHFDCIIPMLKRAAIPFVTVDAEKLLEKPPVPDLYALTKALLDFADRVSWLSVLRAPFCGLKLVDLHALSYMEPNSPIYALLKDEIILTRLTSDGRMRVSKFLEVIEPALSLAGRVPLANLIEETWYKLGGPAALKNHEYLNYAQCYFSELKKYSEAGSLDINTFKQALDNLFAKPEAGQNINIELMTIHKAKGLEFDHVIIPSLEKTTQGDGAKLLIWQDIIRENGENNLLMATIKKSTDTNDAIYKYLNGIEIEKNHNEMKRLLYVALTRAKKTLHLLGNIAYDQEKHVIKPPKGSFLAELEDALPIDNLSNTAPMQIAADNGIVTGPFYRLPLNWQNPLNVKERRDSIDDNKNKQ